ncbi:S-adenosyl-L-methionine-dependent methyltransferase [Mycena floridula]|nr:S-adenosyl-L-methionine-dependent methyltransferase [Mycena floridula]
MDLLPPSSSLPPLARIREYSAAQITLALASLEKLYWPSRLPSTFLLASRPKSTISSRKPAAAYIVPDSGYASAEEDEDDDDDVLRADVVERQFAIRWLTGFIARSEMWTSSASDDHVVERASSILAAFVGGEEETEFALTRSFDFVTHDGTSLKVELNDAPLSSSDHTSVGLQSWGSAILMAQRMALSPGTFLGGAARVLELGAGTGLLSIVAAKLLPESTVVATDYHPDVLENLAQNVKTNSPVSIAVCNLDWEQPELAEPLDAPFDVILAADVIYHPDHAQWIKNCVERLLARPSRDSSGGIFWLVIPLRTIGRHEGMDDTVDKVFCLSDPRSQLVIKEQVQMQRQSNVGRADENGYKRFRIQWSC